MATTTELVDLVCADTGLDSSERTAALARLNHAYRQIVQQGGGVPEDVTIDSSDAGTSNELDLSDAALVGTPMATRFLALDEVRSSKSGVTTSAMKRDTQSAIRNAQNVSASGSPAAYSFVFPRLYLDRSLDGSTDIELDVRLGPMQLVETASVAGTSEETPTALPAVWHERLLGSLACVLVLERYEGREADASYHRGLYNEAIGEYRYNRQREGGMFLPGGADLYNTPNIIGSR